MQIVESESSNIEYEVTGRGLGLVLIHGTGGDAKSNWGHLVDRLAEHRTVVRPNYSGSGGTIDNGGRLSAHKLASQVIAAAQASGTTPFDLVGFSLGASVATYIAAEYPELVRRVVLLAGFASGDDSRLRLQFNLWNRLIDTDRRAAAQLILLTGFSPAFLSSLSDEEINANVEAIISNNNWEGMRRQVDLDLDIDVRDQARRIRKPTLIIGCRHDHMVAPANALALAKLIDRSVYQEIVSGHLATLERPDEFLRLTLQFLLR